MNKFPLLPWVSLSANGNADCGEGSFLTVGLAMELPQGKAPTYIQLLPAGEFRSSDGRPGNIDGSEVESWYLDAALAGNIIQDFRSRKNETALDYEHQTQHSVTNGKPAPAAGWFKNVEWVEGKGLFATGLRWTPAAAKAIAEGEYRYISPVIAFHPITGAVLGLQMASLVNRPAVDGMAAIQAALSAQASPKPATRNPQPATINQKEPPMDKLAAQLRADLNLPADAGEDTILAALKAKREAAKAAQAELSAQVVTLKAAAENPPESKFVALSVHQPIRDELATLKAAQHQAAVTKAVEAALGSKLLPAEKDWALSYAGKDMSGFQEMLKARPDLDLGRMQSAGMQLPTSGENDPQAIAYAALKYQQDKAAAGITVTTTEAVYAVSKP